MSNPLIGNKGLPRFDQISPEHVVPAVTKLLEESRAKLESLEQNVTPTWAGIVEPLNEMDRGFEQVWSPVGHLLSVKNSEELRAAYEAVLPQVVEFGLRMEQSVPIFEALMQLCDGDEWSTLNPAQQRIIHKRIQSAELAGVGLEGDDKTAFNDNSNRLANLGTKFSNNVLDARKAFSLDVTDPADAEGWPSNLKQLASQTYNKSEAGQVAPGTPEAGPWRITLEIPLYLPFMQHCRNRELRREIYFAMLTMASSGEFDNQQICHEILKLRKQQAKLLGFENWASVSLSTKMAKTVAAVDEMLERIRSVSFPAAEQDLRSLQEHAKANGETAELKQWDIEFWSERLRETKYKFTDEELRPYFPHERVVDGLFSLAERLFGLRIEQFSYGIPLWNPDVRYYQVADDAGKVIAGFYYDPYSRPEDKQGGAWMNTCLSRCVIDDEPQLPVAHLVCNCTPPVGDQPALMSFREVETLFHEFGHGLQHMLTTIDYPDAAGISGVEWDAVELPSLFMENWCYHRATLMGMSHHFETNAPLPEELFEKIVAARYFREGLLSLRQISLGLVDIRLHSDYDPEGDQSIFEMHREIMKVASVLPVLDEDRFLCGFSHIFAGGYAAGYYSYKWAEMLSADAFSAFEEAGVEHEQKLRELGHRFRDTVLSLGGSKHPLEVFKEFRGREPDPDALLRQSGLLPA